MKFAIATALFTLALAMGVQASIIPLGHHHEIAGHGLSYTAVSGPAHGHLIAAHHPAAVAVHAAGWPYHGDWHHDDGQWHGDLHHDDGLWHGDWHHAAHHPAVAVAAHAAVHPHVIAPWPHHEGTYVAKTRGAVHTAPLSGHANSAAAINVAPAPGTV